MLADNLKRLRKEKGWSQQKLAEKAGISYVVITKVEQGQTKDPTLSSLTKLADALGVSLDELAGRSSSRSSKK